MTRQSAIVSWSGGKDSSMALHEIIESKEFDVVALLTTVSQEHGRISHHGVREQLLDEQAKAIGIPLHKVFLPTISSHPCTDAVYEDIMGPAMRRYVDQGVSSVVFGDIYLEDLRAYREANLNKVGMDGVFPLWKRDTTELIRQWWEVGFRAVVCCAESMLNESFVGVELDADFISRLPAGIDPCGENGEFHSFVFDGPLFKQPVNVRVGRRVTRDNRFYADLLTDLSDSLHPCVPPVR